MAVAALHHRGKMGGGGDGLLASGGCEGSRILNAAHGHHGNNDDESSTTTATMPQAAVAAAEVGRPKPAGPQPQQQQQQPSPSSARGQPPRSIYEGKERIPFWDAPLLVAVAANLVWPALLLLLTGWSMLVVLYFRLERLVGAALCLRRPSGGEDAGEDDAPVDVGLHWFGHDNHCEKMVWAEAEGAGPGQRCFDPSKPSVIYVHGFARRTTARRFRETFNWAHNDAAYGLDVNAADAWLDAGWNVGIFYWNAHADEEMPQDTESKIWTSNGRTGMRYRTFCPKKGAAWCTPKAPAPSISQQLADVLARVFRGSRAGYRLVGHSLGTQLVVHASTLLMQQQAREAEDGAGGAAGMGLRARIVLPTRIALLDVFGTLGIKAYLSGWPIMAVVQRELGALRARGVVLEQYQSSLIGRRGLWFRHLTAFIQLDPANIPWWRLKSRHIAAIYLYFLSFGPHALEGPRPKKADLRRHQSAQIMVMLSRPSSAVALADDAADDGAGGAGIMMLNLDLADVLAGGGDSGGGDAELEAAAAAAAALQDSGSSSLSSPSSFSSLGDSSNSSAGSSGSGGKKEKGAKEPSLLPRTFRTTITRIIRRRRRTRLSSTSSSSAASLSPSLPSEPLSGHGGRAGSRSSGRLAAVSEEAVKRTSSNSTETIAAVEPSGPGKDGAWATAWTAAAGGIATTESVVTTMTTVNSTAAFATTTRRSSRAALCDAGLPAPALAPALCHHHFVPYKAPAESRNHFRWLLRATKAGDCYHEVEVGQFPLMARATDAEMRELMECGYAYKQHNGHLFLRVSRAW